MSNDITLAQRLEQAGSSAAQSWIITEMLLNAYSPTIRESVVAVAVPHWFTAEILAALLDLSAEEAQQRYIALQELSIVQPFANLGYTLHDLTRNGILKNLATDQRALLQHYGEKLLTYFVPSVEPQQEVERIYALLTVNPAEGRAALQSNARFWRRKGNFAAVENLLRNYRELIDVGWLTSEHQLELEQQEYWMVEALADHGKREKDDHSDQNLRKAIEHFAPPDQLAALLANEPTQWRGQVDRYKQDYVLAQLENARTADDRERQPFWMAELATIQRKQEQLEAALQGLNEAVALFPDNAITLAQRGVVYWLMKRYEDAWADFDCAIALDEKMTQVIANRGWANQSLKRYEEALADFDRAIALDEKYAWAFAQRGVTYQSLKRYEEALADFDRAIALDEKIAWAFLRRGVTYRLLKRYEEALADFDRAIALDEKDAWAFALRGWAYRLLKRYEEALANFDRAIALDEKMTWAIAQRGWAYQSLKRYEEALADFDRAIVLDEKFARAIGGRGYTYLLMHRYPEAQKDLTSALSMEEHNWRFYCRGLLSLAQNEIAMAHSDLRRAIELADIDYSKEPQNWLNTLNLMLYHLVAGDHVAADRLLQEAIDGNAPMPHLQGAVQDLEELLTVLPDHAQAPIFLGRINAHLKNLRHAV